MADRSEQEQGQPEMWEIRRFHAGYRRGARDRRAGVDTSGHRDGGADAARRPTPRRYTQPPSTM
jgi:hypothetical protein